MELVAHRETGYVCRTDSLDALLEGLVVYLGDPAARDRASQRCLERGADPLSEYSPARFAQRWLAVFGLDAPRGARAASVEETAA